MKRRRRVYVRALGAQELRRAVASLRVPLLVTFGAPWCPGCRSQLYWLQRMCRNFRGKVAIYMVDAEREGALARELDIEALPTLVVFDGGREVARWTGYRSRAMLQRQVMPLVSLLADRCTVPAASAVTQDDVRAIRTFLEKPFGDLVGLLARISAESKP